MKREFKIGDCVISTVDHLLCREIIKGKSYFIDKESYNTFSCEFMYGVEGSDGVFSKTVFKLNKLYYRKKKITKILNEWDRNN